MEWITAYPPDTQPSYEEVAEFIDSPLWVELNDFLKTNYEVEPDMSYSGCSGQPGWNIKYKKAGRSLCVLYPLSGFFIAMIVIGNKEYEATMEAMPSFTPYTQKLFNEADAVMGGRWLMMHIVDKNVLEDAKTLIQIRRPIKKKKADKSASA